MSNLANRIIASRNASRSAKVVSKNDWVELCIELNKLESEYTLDDSKYSNTIRYRRASGSTSITITDQYGTKSWFSISSGCDRDENKRCEFFGSKSIEEIAAKIHKKVIELTKANQLKAILKEEKKIKQQSTLEVINEALKTFPTSTPYIMYQKEAYTIDLGKLRCSTKNGKDFYCTSLHSTYNLDQIKELYQLASLSNIKSPLDELILANLGLALLSNSALVRERAEKLAKNISKE